MQTTWPKPAKLIWLKNAQQELRLQEFYVKYDGDFDKVLREAMRDFGWSKEEARQGISFMFSRKDMN